ncbi:GntR family transcriptional regulator [Streptomyces malaysiensis]|uniref:GntR family transcriptional regulator n=1 Tax=Streptomyces malaysiensis TaxID=92644 RepID=UPI000852B08B|nr:MULTISPECIES: UTRA domain-containing protein [Streptomyces]QDL72190.1 UTRA domain-containing protein [Streptomyces malaysiensis]
MASDAWISSSMPYLRPVEAGGQGDAWGEEAAARGRRGTQRILHAGEVSAPAAVARLLGLENGDTVVVRRRIMYLDEEPCELTDSYYPAHIAAGTGLAGTAKIRGGAVGLLAELGHVGQRVREDVTARLPDARERELLRTGAEEPVLCLERVVLDEDKRPIQADLITMPAQRQRLRYELRMG